jgi:hypothetical protein
MKKETPEEFKDSLMQEGLDLQLLTTHLYIVIDEEHLETLKGSDGITAQFTDRQEADSFASERLEIWSIKEIFFKHKWIQHTPNY